MVEDRTPDLGFFNYARSYQMAGDALVAAKVNSPFADMPVRLLYFHAIELYLKAF
jgi:hypothetical protein